MSSFLRALAAVAVAMLILDLTWLGIAAAPLYDRALGPLKAPEVNGLAAILFYAMYAVATTLHTLPAPSVRAAAGRGAALGFVTYATYELTNWAVIRDWPAWLVPIDVAWGVALTATAGALGHLAARSTATPART